MASLNIGYWVILFSLVSAQLTASGVEVCDMQRFSCHTEEESDVALMQIKARGSKLLQQAVERLSGLSGKPQKSKQHFEKITEDMKTLASQALMAKRKSGNITGGGITDPLTKDALNIMNDSAQLIVEQAVNESVILRNALAARSANLEACEDDLVGLDPAVESAESAHDTCRQEETPLYVAYRDQKLAYETEINTSAPPTCTQNWISTCTTNPASTFYEIENAEERVQCLSLINDWAQALEGSVQSVDASTYQPFVDKMAECNTAQKDYEAAFCNHRRLSVSRCQEALRCYEREKAVYDEQAKLVSSGAHKSAYAAGKTILCLIDKLLTNLSETAVASCNATQVDTSSLDIEIQNLPPSSFPPWDCELSLDVHPCTDSWMQIYFDKPWYKDPDRAHLNAEYNITCRHTGCNAETYTQVYPGFPVAKGPGVWFKEANLQPNQTGALQSWVDLGENAYQCNVTDTSALHPSVKYDSNSCLNTVQFPGKNAFRNNTYRPNIGVNGMEVWVVARPDVVDGKQFMVDNGEFNSNGLGFYFEEGTPNNIVVAYAKGGKTASGDIPATSDGLNVWRAQWKNHDSSESRDGYITVSLNNLVLANSTINSDIDIDYTITGGREDVGNKFFTLGGQSKSPDRFWNGTIAEVMIFQYILSHDEAATVKYALWEKWGIQGGSGSCTSTSTTSTTTFFFPIISTTA